MKKLLLTALLTLCPYIWAAEFRIGSASFNWNAGMTYLKSDFGIDTNVYSISQTHTNISNTRFYYFYNADMYQSDFVDKTTDLITKPITYDFPFFGSFNDAAAKYTPIPVSSDYRVRGFDINIGAGFDLFSSKKAKFGLGINNGVTIIGMKMKNLKKSVNLAYDLLDSSETSISTYKIGPVINANYSPFKNFLIYGSYGIGYQTGSMENDYIASSIDINGRYSMLDTGLRYDIYRAKEKDLGWTKIKPLYFISAGYSYKKWNVNDAKIDAFNIVQITSGGTFTNSFDTDYFYIGAGMNF